MLIPWLSLLMNVKLSSVWAETRAIHIIGWKLGMIDWPSNFGTVCKLRETTSPESVLKDLCGYRTFTSIHTDYGRKHEPAARRKYQYFMQNSHPGLTVKKCGLLVSGNYPHIGASPDGLVNCTHCAEPHGLLEIKCPSSILSRMKIPEECAKDVNFYCTLNESEQVILKRNHSYHYQVQGQMAVSGRKCCADMSWDYCWENPFWWRILGISVEKN